MKHPAPGGPDEDIELEEPGLDPDLLRRRRHVMLTMLAGLLVLGAATFAAAKFLRAPPRSEADILLVVQESVKRKMGPGVMVQFAPEGRRVTAKGDGLYHVSGQFVAVASQGLPFYFAFDCAVQDSAKEGLQASSVNITPLF